MSQKPVESLWRRFLRKFRAIVIAGLAVTVPIGITAWIIAWLFDTVDKILQPAVKAVFGRNITGVGFGVVVALILIVGAVATNVIGKRIVKWGESALERVPISRIIYVAVKQVVQGFADPGKNGYLRVVLVEFPIKGMRAIAFVTNEQTDQNGEMLYTVFIPNVPNPMTGFMEIVYARDTVPTSLTVEDAIKMVVSVGRLSPETLYDSLTRAKAQDNLSHQESK